MAGVNGKIGNRTQSAQVCLLSDALLWVVRTRRNQSREVANVVDLVIWQQARTKRGQVEPTILRVLYAAVVKIEPIDVDVRP
jgi:hypothetical protein